MIFTTFLIIFFFCFQSVINVNSKMHEWCSTKISIFWLNQSIPHHSRGPMDSEPLWLRYFGDLFFRIPIKSTSSKSFTYTLKLILYVIQKMEFLKILSYWINLIIKHNNNKKRRYMYLVRGDNDHDSKMKSFLGSGWSCNAVNWHF